MTLEDLKAEAKAMGYSLVAIKKRERLLPCTCGCKRRDHWERWAGDHYEITLKCMMCGKSAKGNSEDEAARNWNELIRQEE